MKNHNLDDLFDSDKDSKKINQRNLLILIGLILTILLMGIFLAKLLLGKSPSPSVKKSDTNLTIIKKDNNNTLKKSKESPLKSKLPDELKPIKPKIDKNKTENKEEENNPPLDMNLINAITNSSSTTKDDKSKTKIENNKKPKPKPKSNDRKTKKRVDSSKVNRHTSKVKKTNRVHSSSSRKKDTSNTHIKHKTKNVKASKLFKGVKRVRYYIQIGSFKEKPSKSYIKNLQAKGYRVNIIKSRGMFKVRIGSYKSYNEAKRKLSNIKKRLGLSGFIVRKN